MAAITITAADVRPVNASQCIIRRFTAGGTLTPGDFVYIASDGDVERADADDVAQAQTIGVVIADQFGSVSFAAGVTVDVVLFGPIVWGASMTPGGVVYVSPTAGKGDQTASATTGDFNFVGGRALTATTLLVHPQVTVPTAVS
jgi:hypothetical protein